MNEDNNNNDNVVLNESNDLPVVREDEAEAPVLDTDELPSVTTENEQA